MKNRDVYWRRYKIKETLFIVHCSMVPQSPSKQAPWHLTQFSPSPPAAPTYFPRSHRRSETSSLSKVVLVLGKAGSSGVPRPASTSHCQWPIFVACIPHTLSILRSSACCRPSRTWVTSDRFSTVFEASVPHISLLCTLCIIPESLPSHPGSFHGGMFVLNTKSGADSLLCSLSF